MTNYPSTPSRMVNEADLDICSNSSSFRATTTPITVRSITFPANPLGANFINGIGTPISTTTGSNVAIDTGQLLTGIITIKPTASINVTFDTAAQMVAGVNTAFPGRGAQIGDIIEAYIINGASATFTLAPQSGSGVTFDSNQANTTIGAGVSRQFWFRLTNVTIGSEAVTVYW